MASENADLDRLRRAVGVQAIDDGSAHAVTRANVDGKRLFGGQMIAQSLAACEHTVPAGMVPDSMHANLLGQGEPYDTIDYTIERVRDGGSLQHRDVRGVQKGRPIVHAAVVTAKPRDGLTWQRSALPEVGPPDVGGSQPPSWATELGDDGSQIVNPVGGDGGQVPTHPLWFRTAVDVPADDLWLNAVVLAYWSDFGLNGAAIQAIWAAGGTATSTSVTHSLWFHHPVQTNDWHLFVIESQKIAGHQGFVHGSFYRHDGLLVASVAQGVFVRP